MDRRACTSYGYTPRSQLPTTPKGYSTLGKGAISPPTTILSPNADHTVAPRVNECKGQRRVHFEPSSARKALSTLKSFTNWSIKTIRNNYSNRSGNHRHQQRQPGYSCHSQWISDAANPSSFTNPRSLRPPFRSCIQRRQPPPAPGSVRSFGLGNELNYAKGGDEESLIDFSIDTSAINHMWLPLSPTPYRPPCIKDIEDLFA